MRRYRELVTDPAWQLEQERREAVKSELFFKRLLEWDGMSEELPQLVDQPSDKVPSQPTKRHT